MAPAAAPPLGKSFVCSAPGEGTPRRPRGVRSDLPVRVLQPGGLLLGEPSASHARGRGRGVARTIASAGRDLPIDQKRRPFCRISRLAEPRRPSHHRPNASRHIRETTPAARLSTGKGNCSRYAPEREPVVALAEEEEAHVTEIDGAPCLIAHRERLRELGNVDSVQLALASCSTSAPVMARGPARSWRAVTPRPTSKGDAQKPIWRDGEVGARLATRT